MSQGHAAYRPSTNCLSSSSQEIGLTIRDGNQSQLSDWRRIPGTGHKRAFDLMLMKRSNRLYPAAAYARHPQV